MQKWQEAVFCSIAFVSLVSCSNSTSDEILKPGPEMADYFFLSAELVRPENLPNQTCPVLLLVEIAPEGVGMASWNNNGETGHHGCEYDPDQDYQKTEFALSTNELEELKKNFAKFEWQNELERIENVWPAPNARCDIRHNSLPDINLTMGKDGKFATNTVYSYEFERDRVSIGCKVAIKNEVETVQKIIDSLPVDHPFSPQLEHLLVIRNAQ